jgi:hypothetical protein
MPSQLWSPEMAPPGSPPARSRSSRPRPGSTRPKEARRPERPASPVTGSTAIVLCPATFVELTADQERRAIGALAELLVPLLGDAPHAVDDAAVATHVATIGDT